MLSTNQSGDDVMVVVPICAAQETAGWETLLLLCDGGTGSGDSEHLATVTELPAPALPSHVTHVSSNSGKQGYHCSTVWWVGC